ncbi:MAG: DUF4296 domain-containing protein [Bacteroidales bacterium]|nr:DUF4296 domain-containing protein [Bacteroidales bacterium]
MKRILQNIMIMAALAACILTSCGKDEAEVIPRGKLARIYAEMLVTDQWIMGTQGVRLIADTSAVYGPILEKYGYDIEDYLLSVDNYMNNPERFARIFRASEDIIEKRLIELRKEQRRLAMLANLPQIKVTYDPSELSKYMSGEAYVHYYDSMTVELDSAKMYYKIVDHATSDTTYEGLKMVILSEIVLDSLARIDTIAVADSIAKADSILKEKPKTERQVEGVRLNLPDNAKDREVVRPQFKKSPEGQLEF